MALGVQLAELRLYGPNGTLVNVSSVTSHRGVSPSGFEAVNAADSLLSTTWLAVGNSTATLLVVLPQQAEVGAYELFTGSADATNDPTAWTFGELVQNSGYSCDMVDGSNVVCCDGLPVRVLSVVNGANPPMDRLSSYGRHDVGSTPPSPPPLTPSGALGAGGSQRLEGILSATAGTDYTILAFISAMSGVFLLIFVCCWLFQRVLHRHEVKLNKEKDAQVSERASQKAEFDKAALDMLENLERADKEDEEEAAAAASELSTINELSLQRSRSISRSSRSVDSRSISPQKEESVSPVPRKELLLRKATPPPAWWEQPSASTSRELSPPLPNASPARGIRDPRDLREVNFQDRSDYSIEAGPPLRASRQSTSTPIQTARAASALKEEDTPTVHLTPSEASLIDKLSTPSSRSSFIVESQQKAKSAVPTSQFAPTYLVRGTASREKAWIASLI